MNLVHIIDMHTIGLLSQLLSSFYPPLDGHHQYITHGGLFLCDVTLIFITSLHPHHCSKRHVRQLLINTTKNLMIYALPSCKDRMSWTSSMVFFIVICENIFFQTMFDVCCDSLCISEAT